MDLVKRIIGIILVAAVVTALVLLVVGFIRSRSQKTQTTTVTTISTEVAPNPQTNGQPTVVNTTTTNQPEPIPQTGTNGKSYNSMGNIFSFPNWGVLNCSNSTNFELDPTDNSDSRVVCDVAQKSITVMVNSNLACKGQPSTIGNMNVAKYRVENVRGVDYQWCFSKNGVNYNITHRVSSSGVRGTSVEDYSARIEEMIGAVK